MRISLMVALVFWAGTAHAAIVHVPIKSNLGLRPGEAYTITVETTEPVEIGWLAVQSTPCATDCVQATDLSGGINYSIATKLGASKHYTPVSGKVLIEYKNVSDQPVTIDVYRVKRTCEAEACKFLDQTQKGRWLVYKVDEFKSITTSRDESYSVISGVAVAGRPFRFKAVWWTEDKKQMMANCAPFVARYLTNHTSKQEYRPYIISGQAVGDGDDIVLKSIDTCAPKAEKFGVPDKNVFK
jgi:hypothetical protein